MRCVLEDFERRVRRFEEDSEIRLEEMSTYSRRALRDSYDGFQSGLN